MSYLTIANYALVFALWTAILALYLRYRRVALFDLFSVGIEYF